MINNFEVGAIFTIGDEASPILRDLATQMEALDGLAKTLQASLTEISTITATLGDSFSTMNRRMTGTITRMERLTVATKEYQTIAAAAMAEGSFVGVGGGGRRGGGGGRRGGGGAAAEEEEGMFASGGRNFAGGVAKGAGLGGMLMHPATMIAGIGAYEGISRGANLEDTVNRSMVAMGETLGDDYMSTEIAQKIQEQILNSATKWGTAIGDTSGAALDAVRLLAPRSEEDRMKLLPSLLNFAGAEVRGKPGTSMEEAVDVGVGLAHQLRDYSPEEIEPVLKQFAQLSMATHSSLTQFSRASSYYLPLLNAGLGMDPEELMAIGTVGSQMGLNTKSGTWLAQLFQAPFTADLTSKRGAARKEALQELGIVDGKGNITTKDPIEFLKTLSEHAADLTPEERSKDSKAAFGMQGARGAAIFSDPAVLQNIAGLQDNFKNAKGIDQLQSDYSKSPRVQIDQQIQTFNKELTLLGENILPAAILGLKSMNAVLNAMGAIWNLDKTVAGITQKEQSREALWTIAHPGQIPPPPPAPPLPGGFTRAPGAPLKEGPAPEKTATQVVIHSLTVQSNDGHDMLRKIMDIAGGAAYRNIGPTSSGSMGVHENGIGTGP